MIYNVTNWGGSYECHLKNLIIQQKRMIRAIADAGYADHTNPLFFRLKLLKFKDIYRYFVSIYMFKNLTEFSSSHNLNTRQRNLANPPFFHLTKSQHSIKYCGPKIWNDLPHSIRSSKTLPSFKRAVKSYYFERIARWPLHVQWDDVPGC